MAWVSTPPASEIRDFSDFTPFTTTPSGLNISRDIIPRNTLVIKKMHVIHADIRFGGRPDAQSWLHLADRWAAEAGERLIGQAMMEFGAVELMVRARRDCADH
jgi:hypothetical protein